VRASERLGVAEREGEVTTERIALMRFCFVTVSVMTDTEATLLQVLVVKLRIQPATVQQQPYNTRMW
jgi:hypothetical protein